jgi:5-methyltetrahydrofolate--homocysteine methyltransferase
MAGLIEMLKAGKPLVSDGAMSTQLQLHGLSSGDCPEEWNITNPEAVASVYRSYIDAGSDLISTNTFGGNPLKLDRYGIAARTGELNEAGIRIAKQEAAGRALVVASIGPTGHLIEPLGELSADDAYSAFKRQAEAVASAGADAILFETFFDLTEIEQGIKAAISTGLPIICTMTFDTSGRTVMGLDPARAAQALVDLGATVVGSNCGVGPDAMLAVIETMAKSGAYVMAQPNAGLPHVDAGETTYDITPDTMAEYAVKFISAGASIVGGCCGSTPAHIAAIAKAVKGP